MFEDKEVMEIPVLNSAGRKAKVDLEDFQYLSQFNWEYLKNANCRTGHAKRGCHGAIILMHHEILARHGISIANEVDHKDGDGLNNQKENLRCCTHSQNCANVLITKRNTSGFKGVSRFRNKWKAEITHNYKRIYLGLFVSKIDAALEYDHFAKLLFGEFAALNFPE